MILTLRGSLSSLSGSCRVPSRRTVVLGGLAAALLGCAPLGAAAQGDLSLSLSAGPGRFRPGEPVPLELTARYRGQARLTLVFPTAQRYDFAIETLAGAVVWRWSAGQMFAQVLGQIDLSPARPELRYAVTAEPSLPPGRYRVRGWLTSRPPLEAPPAPLLIE